MDIDNHRYLNIYSCSLLIFNTVCIFHSIWRQIWKFNPFCMYYRQQQDEEKTFVTKTEYVTNKTKCEFTRLMHRIWNSPNESEYYFIHKGLAIHWEICKQNIKAVYCHTATLQYDPTIRRIIGSIVHSSGKPEYMATMCFTSRINCRQLYFLFYRPTRPSLETNSMRQAWSVWAVK